jgi:hypothetical protein
MRQGYKVKSPILFLVFNRPEETRRVFDAIRKAEPKVLYLAADGPRPSNEQDVELCALTKNVLRDISWPCEVRVLYQEVNLGCKIAVSRAISWFFENEEEGIILEDDCLPSQDFFRFCDEQLEFYRDDHRIGHICGVNFQDNLKRGTADYYFSRLSHVWGWASWRRVWSKYDLGMVALEEGINIDFLESLTSNRLFKKFLYKEFLRTKGGQINTWDYQYFYSNILNGYLSIIPNYNMISNIGFNESGTHTFNADSPLANMKHQPLPLHILAPKVFVPNKLADTYSLNKEIPSLFKQYYSSIIYKANLLLNR